ncbi:hypothetical protein T484DRAFT_1776981, partial [Baffinella frigidus]
VKYELLYKEDINFDQGPFLEAVRDQYLQERTEFLIEAGRAGPRTLQQGGLPHHQVLVTPDEGLEALRLTDPCAPVSELHRLWRIGFGLTNGLPDDDAVISVQGYLVNLRRTVLKWHTVMSIEVNGVAFTL